MPVPVPGFSEQIEGMEKGQEKEFTIAIPSDFKAPKIAGKTCSFKVKLNEVRSRSFQRSMMILPRAWAAISIPWRP